MISVITICYNERGSIRATMDSVLSQTYQDFEYIIKDGGSTDDTVEIAKSYEDAFHKKGIRFKVISGKDKGIYDGMNAGVREASGDWINFMNAGDEFFSKDVLEKIFAGRNWDGTDLIFGDTAEEEFGELHYFRKCPELIEARMPFSHQSVFVRREEMLKHPFDLKYPIGADYNFLLTLNDEKKVFSDSDVLVARISKTGTSSVRLRDTFLESIQIRREHGIPQPTDEELRKKMWWIDLKQFGMDHFPKWLKYAIRSVQRTLRGQKKV
ncbi:Glycosyl transferase family 2 [Lachnospiraceae bacterium]|nr:Glycosyl transferase family 2 [Lachnospiraceae bacterium]